MALHILLVLGSDKDALGRICSINFLKASEYLSILKPTLEVQRGGSEEARVRVPATAIPEKATGKSTIELNFPPKLNAQTLKVQDGVYSRTISLDTNINNSVVLSGNVKSYGDAIRAEVSIDGVRRAMIYTSATKAEIKNIDWQRTDTIRLRASATDESTIPVADFPVVIEADNAPDRSILEMKIRQSDADDAAENTEIILLPKSRQERVWMEMGGGIVVSNRISDWAVPLNLINRRGKIEVNILLKAADGKAIAKSDPLTITVQPKGN